MDVSKEIEAIVLREFSPATWSLVDDSARHRGHSGRPEGSGHFTLTIVSEKFLGKSRLESHRMVMAVLGHLIPDPVHALSLQLRAT